MDAAIAAKIPASVDDTLAMLGSADYIADRSLATAVHLALHLKRPLFLEGEAGVGKTEIAKVLATALEAPADPPAMLRRSRRRLGGLRVGLRPPDDRDPPRRGSRGGPRRDRKHDLFRPVSDQAAAVAGAGARPRRRAGAADRRARPHRRAVRGLSPRAPLRFSGDDPRDRHDPRRAAADRHHHLEPHPRDPRRVEAALLLLLGRLSERRRASSKS